MSNIDFNLLADNILRRSRTVLPVWLPGGKLRGHEYVCKNKFGGEGNSFSVNIETGVWKEFGEGGGPGGSDLTSLYAEIHSVSQIEAARELIHSHGFEGERVTPSVATIPSAKIFEPVLAGVEPPLDNLSPHSFDLFDLGSPSMIFTYHSITGSPLYYIARYETDDKKQLRPWSFFEGRWQVKGFTRPRPIYNLHLLTEFPKKRVLVTEGEKSAEAAHKLLGNTYVVTTWHGGVNSWKYHDWSILREREILLWPDDDTVGRECMDGLYGILREHNQTIKILQTDDESGDDAADYLERGWSTAKTVEWAKSVVKTLSVDKSVETVDKRQALVEIDQAAFYKDDPGPSPEPKDVTPVDPLAQKYPTMKDGFFHKIERILKSGQKKVELTPDYIGLGDYMKNEHALSCSDAGHWIFESDHFVHLAENTLEYRIDQLTKLECSPTEVRNFARAVHYKADRPASFFELEEGLINLKNGVLDVRTREVVPHSHDQFFKYVLPHAYEPGSECPEFLKFLNFVFEGNESLVSLTFEIFGYILVGGTPWLHKAFFLDGSGRNGKSTFLEVLKALIGKENYSSIPMKNLDKPFSVVMADGKLANIVGELEGKDLSAETFKIAVGGEELTAARKGKDEYQMKFQARLVFATNNPPQFRDTSAGYYERLCILPFNRFITAEERDPDVVARLLTELPGILNASLDGLDRLKVRGRLPEIEAVEDQVAAYRAAGDSVLRFFEDALVETEDAPSQLTLGDYYSSYVDWCKDEGCHSLAKNSFCRNLLRLLKRKFHPNLYVTHPHNKTSVTGKFDFKKYSLDSKWLPLKADRLFP